MTERHPFHDQLSEQLPALRAFARTLARDASHADDLAQEALLKAWANRHRFEQGTNLRAWLFTILRNAFYSEHRKRRREVADVDEEHSRKLASRPRQDHAVALSDFYAAYNTLPADQREALALIAAAGMAYEEAAAVTGVAVGTVKSRVSRARAQLSRTLDIKEGAELTADERMDAALAGTVSPTA